jgi:putative addiction module component (TIGR02574 family)
MDAPVSPHPDPLPEEEGEDDAILSAMQRELTEAAKKLSISDRILLVEEIWETIAKENQTFELSDAQKEEMDRRLDSPRNGSRQRRTWDEIKAEFIKTR